MRLSSFSRSASALFQVASATHPESPDFGCALELGQGAGDLPQPETSPHKFGSQRPSTLVISRCTKQLRDGTGNEVSARRGLLKRAGAAKRALTWPQNETAT